MSAIEVDHVSKRFSIRYDRAMGLKERVIFWGRERVDQFWALRDVTLKVEQGAALGLIGRNGSGKSTLLKLMSRIMYPDGGTIRVRGRVSSLLELGAGFHQDFTGRENIYLNASILGLSRPEIRAKMSDIIEFSEVGEFIDNPVRNYSSGMFMRLGFSVAVHVDPEILLIDEVLAVGDVGFQQKCLRRIADLRRRGVTIVLVSHSPGQVQEICDTAVWLHEGEVRAEGSADRVTEAYLEFMGAGEGPGVVVPAGGVG